MDNHHHTAMAVVVQPVIQHGVQDMAAVDGCLLGGDMAVKQEIFLSAQHDHRATEWWADRNSAQAARLDMSSGSVIVPVPKTAGYASGKSSPPKP